MPTLVSQIDPAAPADASAANQLAAQLRAFKAQVKDLLLVIMDDNGALKSGVLASAAQLGDEIIGSTQLGQGVVDSQHIAPDALDPVHFSDSSVRQDAIADLQVNEDKLAAGAVTAIKLATDAVETVKIKDDAVTGDKIADTTITSAKLISVDGAKVLDGTVPVAKLTVSPSGIRLPVINTTTAGSKLATIGGVLSATLVGDVLTFALGSGAVENGTIAVMAQTASGATSAAAYTDRTVTTRIRGEALVEPSGAHIKMLTSGVFLVVYTAMGYSCGSFKVNLTDDSDNIKITGTASYAGPGQQTVSYGCDVLSVAAAGELYKLRHYAELAQPANGQGLLVGGGGTDYTAMVTFIGM